MINPQNWMDLQAAAVEEDRLSVILDDILVAGCACETRGEDDDRPCPCSTAYEALNAAVQVTEAADARWTAQQTRLKKWINAGIRV